MDNNAYLKEISVLPEYGQQTIGTQLLETIISWAKQQAYTYITLRTFRNILFNAPFYQKHGFQPFNPTQKWPELMKIQRREEGTYLASFPRVFMRKAIF